MNQTSIFSVLLKVFLGTLALTALVGIVIFIIGSFGELESKILVSSVAMSFFSLLGMASASIINKKQRIALFGMACSLLALLTFQLLVWEFLHYDIIGKLCICLTVLSISLAHISLLLRTVNKTTLVKRILMATIICIVLLSLIIITLVVFGITNLDVISRIIGVLAILIVLGTISIPILIRLNK